MRAKTRVRHHKTPAQKAEILAGYERSGSSLREFAMHHGVSSSTLQRWARQGRMGQAEAGGAKLVEVPNLFADNSAVVAYRVRFPRGLVLEVVSGFQPEELRSLAQVIQSL